MSYSIKEVSELFNISPYTLRYYEKEGLLPAIHRSDKGYRLYNDDDLGLLQIICCMKISGMSIAYIKNYVALCRQGDSTVPKRREIILRQKDIIESQIKEYKILQKLVNKKLNYYDNISNSSKSQSEYIRKSILDKNVIVIDDMKTIMLTLKKIQDSKTNK